MLQHYWSIAFVYDHCVVNRTLTHDLFDFLSHVLNQFFPWYTTTDHLKTVCLSYVHIPHFLCCFGKWNLPLWNRKRMFRHTLFWFKSLTDKKRLKIAVLLRCHDDSFWFCARFIYCFNSHIMLKLCLYNIYIRIKPAFVNP